MPEPANTMSVAGYAKARGVGEQTVRDQIAAGVILLEDGRLDVDQADAAWFRIHRPRDVRAASTESRIADAEARLRLERNRLEVLSAAYLVADAARGQANADSAAIIARLKTIPRRRAARLAELIGRKPSICQAMLERLVASILAELVVKSDI